MGSIDLDAIALHFEKLEHLFPIDWIAKAMPINRKMLWTAFATPPDNSHKSRWLKRSMS
jgi:hypothetical protein